MERRGERSRGAAKEGPVLSMRARRGSPRVGPHAHRQAACGNNAENLLFLLAVRPTFSSVWYFNRKFTCSSDTRSVMSAAVDSPALSCPVQSRLSWAVGLCVRITQRDVMIHWEKDCLRSWDRLRTWSLMRPISTLAFFYFLVDSERHLLCRPHGNNKVWWMRVFFCYHLNTNEKHVLLKFDFFHGGNCGDDLLIKHKYMPTTYKLLLCLFLVKSKDVVTLYVELSWYFFFLVCTNLQKLFKDVLHLSSTGGGEDKDQGP